MPRTTLLRRLGPTAFAGGLLLTSIGLIFTGAPIAGAADGSETVPICNNQRSSTPDANCQGDARHGTLTTSYDASGNLVFDVLATADGFAGWNAIKICIPQVGPTDGADCTGADGPLSPSSYTVTGADGVVEGDKEVTFTCDGAFRATVDASVVAGTDAPSYTVHLTACAGGAAGGSTGTDEAFGSAARPAEDTTTTSSTTSSTSTTSTVPASTTTTPTTTSTTSTVPATTTTTPTTMSTTSTVPATTTPTTTPTTAASVVMPAAPTTPSTPNAVVLSEQLVRPASPAVVSPAVAVAPTAAAAPVGLARTGTTTMPLVPLGLGLTLAGALALVAARRPLTPATVPVSTTPTTGGPSADSAGNARTRPMLLTAGLLLLGTVLGGRRR